MRTVDLIRKKRDSGELSREEINFLVSGYTRGDSFLRQAVGPSALRPAQGSGEA